jgi:hypothetical protein
VAPELLAELRTLAERAAGYRRKSYGRNRNLPRTEENRHRSVLLLSRHLFPMRRLVEIDPELKDEYREWCRLFPLLTSDQDAASPCHQGHRW